MLIITNILHIHCIGRNILLMTIRNTVTVIHHRDISLDEAPRLELFRQGTQSREGNGPRNELKNPSRIVSYVSFDEIRKSGHRTYRERRRPGQLSREGALGIRVGVTPFNLLFECFPHRMHTDLIYRAVGFTVNVIANLSLEESLIQLVFKGLVERVDLIYPRSYDFSSSKLNWLCRNQNFVLYQLKFQQSLRKILQYRV